VSATAGWASLEDLLRHDPGQRGVAALGAPGSLRAASESLAGARSTLILSGFPVWRDAERSEAVAESDGPPGARALGRALSAMGGEVHYASGPRAARLFRALGCEVRATDWTPEEAPQRAATLLDELGPSHVVAVELPGRGACGGYRSLRGELLSTSPTDEVMIIARARGLVTVGIGDGGNEAGLAGIRDQVSAALELGSEIATVVAADHTVVCGVSNWGALALVAGLSLGAGRDLLPSEEAYRADHATLAAAGAIDGILKTSGLEVDGQPWSASARALAWARAALDGSGPQGGV
jgi:D-glutamate cyclase-like protein